MFSVDSFEIKIRNANGNPTHIILTPITPQHCHSRLANLNCRPSMCTHGSSVSLFRDCLISSRRVTRLLNSLATEESRSTVRC